eukprot:808093-Prymnesium_polylepis.1
MDAGVRPGQIGGDGGLAAIRWISPYPDEAIRLHPEPRLHGGIEGHVAGVLGVRVVPILAVLLAHVLDVRAPALDAAVVPNGTVRIVARSDGHESGASRASRGLAKASVGERPADDVAVCVERGPR